MRFVVLTHPHERKVAINTGRMVEQAVRGTRLLVGENFDTDAELGALLGDPRCAPAVLYPSPGALDLGSADPAAVRAVFPADRTPLIVVLDGTWTTAKRILRVSRCLGGLPAIALAPAAPSRYGAIRHAPRPGCLSTLEAVHAVIDHFDRLGIAAAPAGRAHDGLLSLLDALVADVLPFVPPAHRRG